ncbi:MAG: YihY/virulence factor BrkB family protein [Wenzhouxiangella sp.]
MANRPVDDSPVVMRKSYRRLWSIRFRRYEPWITAPDRLDEVLPGRFGGFLSTLGWLLCREPTLLIFAFTFAFLLSIFPLIVLLVSLVGALPIEGLERSFYLALEHFFPVSQQWIVRNLQLYLSHIGVFQVFSLILLAWAGSALFFALEAALECAYRIEQPRNFVGSQIRGTALVLAVGGLGLLAILALHGLSAATSGVFPDTMSGETIFALLFYVLMFVSLVLLLSCAFHWLPDHGLPYWRTLPEALFAASLVILGDLCFRWLEPQTGLQEIYGPFFVSVTILLWGYTFGCIIVGAARLGANGFFRRRANPMTKRVQSAEANSGPEDKDKPKLDAEQ